MMGIKKMLNNFFVRNTKITGNAILKKSFCQELVKIDKTHSDLTLKSENIVEPVDFRTFYIENLPTDWGEVEIKVRLEQIGNLEKMHLIRNSIGESTGRVLATYGKIENVVQAINNFKDKLPFEKPVKIRFFREFKYKKVNLETKGTIKSEVLFVKNIPSDLHKDDLKLFISEFREPIQISFPRDEKNEFKRVAYVYFNSIEDAEYVLKFANLRYVKNKQLFFQFSTNHYDLTDFRTRAELGIKLDPKVEIKLFQKQFNNYQLYFKNKKDKLSQDELLKLEYLKTQIRKLEYYIKKSDPVKAEVNKLTKEESTKKIFQSAKKNQKVLFNEDKSIIFHNENKLI